MGDASQLQGIARLFGSSKGLVFLGVVTAGMVLALAGRLDGKLVYDKIIELAMILMSAVAVEDAARHIAARPRSPAVQQNVNVPATIPPPAHPPGDSL